MQWGTLLVAYQHLSEDELFLRSGNVQRNF